MKNNTIETVLKAKKLNKYIFTFGLSHEQAGSYCVIWAKTYMGARKIMFEHYGRKWAFQYTEEEWNKAVKDSENQGRTLEASFDHIFVEMEVK